MWQHRHHARYESIGKLTIDELFVRELCLHSSRLCACTAPSRACPPPCLATTPKASRSEWFPRGVVAMRQWPAAQSGRYLHLSTVASRPLPYGDRRRSGAASEFVFRAHCYPPATPEGACRLSRSTRRPLTLTATPHAGIAVGHTKRASRCTITRNWTDYPHQ